MLARLGLREDEILVSLMLNADVVQTRHRMIHMVIKVFRGFLGEFFDGLSKAMFRNSCKNVS